MGADKLIEDIEATLLARCGAAGEGGYLSRETVRWLKMWLEHLRIRDGAVFRRLIGKDQIGGPLNPGSIAPIFKRVAQWIEMPERFVGGVSRHSTRVGETQDLAALDIDLAAITQAGGRKSTRMPLQYCGEDQCGNDNSERYDHGWCAARRGTCRLPAGAGSHPTVSHGSKRQS
jgi:hypothetical protein